MVPKTISIIIPVYNRQKLISRCLDSIVKQTIFNELDVIVVDDGSTDLTVDVINEYVSRYPDNIRLIKHLQNRGGFQARLTGYKNILPNIPYVGFIDSDDWADPGYFEAFKEGFGSDVIINDNERLNMDGDTYYSFQDWKHGEQIQSHEPVLTKGKIWHMARKIVKPTILKDLCLSIFNIDDNLIYGDLIPTYIMDVNKRNYYIVTDTKNFLHYMRDSDNSIIKNMTQELNTRNMERNRYLVQQYLTNVINGQDYYIYHP